LFGANHIELFPLAWIYCSKRLAISSGVLAIYAKASFSTKEFEACDSAMTEYNSLTSMPRARALKSAGATMPVRVRVYQYTPSGSVSDSSELTIGYFPLLLFGVVLGPTMLTVNSGNSASEKILLVVE